MFINAIITVIKIFFFLSYSILNSLILAAFYTFFINLIFFCISSLGPHQSSTLPREMVSRRKILSRSRDDLNLDQAYMQMDDEEDIWYQKDKLFKVSGILMSNIIYTMILYVSGRVPSKICFFFYFIIFFKKNPRSNSH